MQVLGMCAACLVNSAIKKVQPFSGIGALQNGTASGYIPDLAILVLKRHDPRTHAAPYSPLSMLQVMTTNHPEKLDPALIRPGRVNKKVYMGYMGRAEAEQMRAHYFPGVKVTDAQQTSFVSSFVEGVMSPAELEMMCADADDLDDLNAALAGRSLKDVA